MVAGWIRRAAVVVSLLPSQRAGQVLARLEPEQADSLADAIEQLGTVADGEQAVAVGEFVRAFETAEQPPASRFHLLHQLTPEETAALILEEHPQTIALILNYLPASKSTGLLEELPPEEREEVVRRIAKLEPVAPEILRAVEQGLEDRLARLRSHSLDASAGLATAVGILHMIDAGERDRLIDSLAAEDPSLASEIRRRV